MARGVCSCEDMTPTRAQEDKAMTDEATTRAHEDVATNRAHGNLQTNSCLRHNESLKIWTGRLTTLACAAMSQAS